jgi:hypothetical protein
VVVASNGHFVTCLGQGMSTGNLPIVSRGRIDGLAAKAERVKEGLALAKQRGLDSMSALVKLETAGDQVSREDFVAAQSLVGPVASMLLQLYSEGVKSVHTLFPALMTSGWEPGKRRASEAAVARGAWAMAHLATLEVDTMDRDLVEALAETSAWKTLSPWYFLTELCALPFVLRAAWVAGRFGKPLLPSYKARFAKPTYPIEAREAGWGLVAMALRHEGLRSEIFGTLRARREQPGDPEWVGPSASLFAEIANILDEKEDSLREEGIALGRKFAVSFMAHQPDTARLKYKTPEEVPDDVARTSLFQTWIDAHNDERGTDLMLLSIVHLAHARAEELYYPAPALRAFGPPDEGEMGASLVAMRRKLLGVGRSVVRHPQPGRNDPCHCGSGKKFKKCHGR